METNSNSSNIDNSTSNDNPAKVIKIALGYATFENKDIGGALFALVDSFSSDIIYSGMDSSDTTDSLIDDLMNLIATENAEIAGRELDEEDDVDMNDLTTSIMDDEVEDEDEILIVREEGNGLFEDSEDDDEEDDDIEREELEDEDDEDFVINPDAPPQTNSSDASNDTQSGTGE